MAVRMGYFDPTGNDNDEMARRGVRGGGLNKGLRRTLTQDRIPAPAPRKPATPARPGIDQLRKDLTQGRIGTSGGGGPVSTGGGTRNTGSWGYGGPGNYGGFTAPPEISDEDYLAGDDVYQATLSALVKQLERFESDTDEQLQNRQLDFDRAMGDLGWSNGNWDFENTLTASGRAYQNLLNDFAARGMMNSSGYNEAQENLTTSLSDQRTGIETSDKRFKSDMERQRLNMREENEAAQQAARAEAIARRANSMGLGV